MEFQFEKECGKESGQVAAAGWFHEHVVVVVPVLVELCVAGIFFLGKLGWVRSILASPFNGFLCLILTNDLYVY